jgi:hypothetical protein
MDRKPPKTGNPVIDNLLAAAWTLLAVTNFTMSASVFANLMVGAGAAATLVLTMLRIYEHLVGEPISETITGDGDS